jgi:hypothetical protein
VSRAASRAGRGARLAALALAAAGSAGLVGAVAHADAILPPWTDPGDLPLPEWARSVAPLRDDTTIVAVPGHPEARRGTTGSHARLPLFGAKRAPGCTGRWLLVGPLAWICSDAAEVSRDEVAAPLRRLGENGLPYRYYFAGAEGAEAFLSQQAATEGRAEMEAPEGTLDPGFSVALADEQGGAGKTTHGKWIPLSQLVPFKPSPFAGSPVEANGALDFAWVATDVSPVYGAPAPRGKPSAKRARFERVLWREERVAPNGGGTMVRVSEDGATEAQWMRARDLAHPTLSTPPDEAGGASASERWIDVDLAAQVLVAYDGTTPVFATLVSTGRGENATPVGVHRLWVKLRASDMENLSDENDDGDNDRFSIEDVPYVQYFDRGVALHGAFWHHDFGRVHSHGCVNLAPKDAAWLFGFTAPHVEAGWDSAYPTEIEPGTLVRVRGGDASTTDGARGAAPHSRARESR